MLDWVEEDGPPGGNWALSLWAVGNIGCKEFRQNGLRTKVGLGIRVG